MLRRFSAADAFAAAAVVLGVAAAFLPWYAYDTAADHVTVNGFRASLLGDLFFLCMAAVALVVLIRAGLLQDVVGTRIDLRHAVVLLAIVSAGTVLLQLIVDAVTRGRHLGAGLPVAIVAVVAMIVAARLQASDGPRRTVRQMLQGW